MHARRAVLAVALSLACTTNYRAEFHAPPSPADPSPSEVVEPPPSEAAAPFVKLHTLDGEVYVLDSWRFDEQARRVEGEGLRYSAERELLARGAQTVSYEQVALVETNTPEQVIHATSLAIMGVLAGAVTGTAVFCAVNPKACFGSCPTFYVDDGEALDLRAEGFSAAVAMALEERDVDHLGVVDPPAGRFDLVMANEAFESHFLRRVELLSVARPDPAVEVFHSRAGFLGVRDRVAPLACRADAGDCLAQVQAADEREYSSSASEHDLATRETIELEFPATLAGRELALVVRARNSLLDTFLFYQGLAYMGAEVPRWILEADREGADGRFVELLRGFDRVLGDVEVELWDGERWTAAGRFREYGPIAHETQVVELPRAGAGPLRVRLSLTRGRWKLDALSLGERVGPLPATTLTPTALAYGDAPDPEGLAALLDPERRLASYPGDVWTLRYELPAGPQTLFLAAEGFYWEWIREEWLAEQSLFEVARFFADPRATLRRLAPVFKAMEPELEPVFWQTRLQPLPLAGKRSAAQVQP